MFQFEIEVVPLKVWSVPEKYSADVIQLLKFVKVTKECILLGLMAHEDNSPGALHCFETNVMPVVVTNMSLISSDMAMECLQDLKEKCTFSYSGFKVPNYCFKLDSPIQHFYAAHPW